MRNVEIVGTSSHVPHAVVCRAQPASSGAFPLAPQPCKGKPRARAQTNSQRTGRPSNCMARARSCAHRCSRRRKLRSLCCYLSARDRNTARPPAPCRRQRTSCTESAGGIQIRVHYTPQPQLHWSSAATHTRGRHGDHHGQLGTAPPDMPCPAPACIAARPSAAPGPSRGSHTPKCCQRDRQCRDCSRRTCCRRESPRDNRQTCRQPPTTSACICTRERARAARSTIRVALGDTCGGSPTSR